MELSHGPIRERFPIRLPPKCYIDPSDNDHIQVDRSPLHVAGSQMDSEHANCFKAPIWLQNTVKEQGPKLLAESYEVNHPCFIIGFLLIIVAIETRTNRTKKTSKYHAFSF